MKTKLTVDIEYDPEVTDPEGLAVAMDRLLETALSIPGVLDEYGPPKIGEFFVAPSFGKESLAASGIHIDRELFRVQRELLVRIADGARQGIAYAPGPEDERLLEGLVNLTDALADLEEDGEELPLDQEDDRCECEKPGYFLSGVPGIIGRVVEGRLAPGAAVQRCDLCERYPTDEAAFARLVELGIATPEERRDPD